MPVDLDRLRAAHPIDAVVRATGVELRPSGVRLVGRCPFHDDRHPSFTVYPDTASYFCFGCGAGGDVFDLLGRLLGLNFGGVLAHLGAASSRLRRGEERGQPSRADLGWAGQTAPSRPLAVAQAESTAADRDGARTSPDPARLAVVDAAASYYHTRLWRSPAALSYLADRGLSAATVHHSRLGFATGTGLCRSLHTRGLDLAWAEATGLLVGEREPMAGRIIIPDLCRGRATWLTGRIVDSRRPDRPRYLSLRLPPPLFGETQVAGDQVIVVEGVFDWLALRAWNLPVVALLGSQPSRTVLGKLGRFGRVYLALDDDAAGRRATETLGAALGDRAAPVALPAGAKDPADLTSQPGGRSVFLEVLRAAGYGQLPADRAAATPPIGRRVA